jgi:hypothetical protein
MAFVFLLGICSGTVLAEAPDRSGQFVQETAPAFLTKHCFACHSGKSPEGMIRLDDLLASDWADRHGDWAKVIEQIESRSMPPADKPQPAAEEVDRFLKEFQPALKQRLRASTRVSPPTPLRRLNRVQYRNVIRDLLGVDYDPTTHLPADETGYGFDNIGEHLTISPILMEQYLRMAKEIAAAVIITDPEDGAPVVAKLEWPPEQVRTFHSDTFGLEFTGKKLAVGKPIVHVFEIPDDDEYVIKVQALGLNIGPKPLQLAVDIGGMEACQIPVASSSLAWTKVRLRLPKGTAEFAFRPIPDEDPKARRGPILLERVLITRPSQTSESTYPELHRRVVVARPSTTRSVREAAEAIFQPLATRAYRRPATPEQVARLVAIVEQAHSVGLSFDHGVQQALQAMLCSPNFLFLVEAERPAGGPAPVDEFELANRLSFFLWNTMPDTELFDAARAGRLRKDLDRHVDRMIGDARFEDFCRSFTHQWLKLTRLNEFRPDPKNPRYVEFARVRDSAVRETELFFATVLRENLPLTTLIDADFSVVNASLAQFYRLPKVPADAGFQRVDVTSVRRGGLLTHASVLAATSYPTRTSPVVRGAWILESLLNAPPPPPPPDTPTLDRSNEAESDSKLSLRQQLEKHRSNAHCAVCHNRIDPLGFALEGFDIVGQGRRKDDAGQPVDATAVLPSGEKVEGVEGLKKTLVGPRKEQFLSCLTEKMMIYALGRGPDPADVRTSQAIIDALARNEDRSLELIRGIIASPAFNNR